MRKRCVERPREALSVMSCWAGTISLFAASMVLFRRNVRTSSTLYPISVRPDKRDTILDSVAQQTMTGMLDQVREDFNCDLTLSPVSWPISPLTAWRCSTTC